MGACVLALKRGREHGATLCAGPTPAGGDASRNRFRRCSSPAGRKTRSKHQRSLMRAVCIRSASRAGARLFVYLQGRLCCRGEGGAVRLAWRRQLAASRPPLMRRPCAGAGCDHARLPHVRMRAASAVPPRATRMGEHDAGAAARRGRGHAERCRCAARVGCEERWSRDWPRVGWHA